MVISPVLKEIMLPLTLAVVLFGCEDDLIDPGGTSSCAQEVMIGMDGGIFTALDGNVVAGLFLILSIAV